jgi:DnaJ-class molecular chaperone
MISRWPPGWRDLDFYAIIGVPSSASPEQITQAYHRQARTTHPDIDHDHPDAAERFRLLTDAHAVLADPATRAAYDRFRASRVPQARPTTTRRAGAPIPDTRTRPRGATVRPGPVIWNPPSSRPSDGDRG